MSDELRVEFKVAFTGRRPTRKPKSEPGVKVERQRLDRASRRARNLALAHYIDTLIRAGEMADLATVARTCGVSRARVSRTMDSLAHSTSEHSRILCAASVYTGQHPSIL